METIVRPAHTVPPVDTAQAEQMDSLRKRWNSQIARMNGDKPGIEGLMGLTEVCAVAGLMKGVISEDSGALETG